LSSASTIPARGIKNESSPPGPVSGPFFISLIWPIRYILILLVVTDKFFALRSEFRNVGFMMRKVPGMALATANFGAGLALGKSLFKV